jgi:SnoaL-like domain
MINRGIWVEVPLSRLLLLKPEGGAGAPPLMNSGPGLIETQRQDIRARSFETSGMPTMNHTEAVDTYCAAWNETDAVARASILSKALVPDAVYIDPTVQTQGIAELVAHIDKVFARYPGSRIVRTSFVDAHNCVARFAWKKVLADGSSLPEGIDFVEFDDDGRLSKIIGFFGTLKVPDVPN